MLSPAIGIQSIAVIIDELWLRSMELQLSRQHIHGVASKMMGNRRAFCCA